MLCVAEKLPKDQRTAAESSAGSVSLPTLTVVICTSNRADLLLSCVQSVIGQTIRPMELIVVDDGFLDARVKDAMQAGCQSAGISFHYLRKENPGLTQSRNLAVRHARGDIVQFLDDDVTLDPNFCRHILRLYAADKEGALLGTDGTITEPETTNLGARIFDVIYRLAGWWALRPRRCKRPPLPTCLKDRSRAVPTWKIVGATMAFRRSALVEHEFDEALAGYALGEDRDMAYRIGKRGWIVRSAPARVLHYVHPAGRPHQYIYGQMIVRNYVRIMLRNGFTGIGDKLVIAYSLSFIALTLVWFSLANPRRYFPQLLGMVTAGAGLLKNGLFGWIESANHVE
ncbi:MAG: glycosyltransferase family 2 protein [Planctomycetota bacterium]|jgi:glycosyltransferase involved in cell wall biosynthesis